MKNYRDILRAVSRRTVALTWVAIIIFGQLGAVYVQAGPLDSIGGWISDRAEDVSDIAGDAGQKISNSGAAKFIGEKASAAGDVVGNGLNSASEFLGENASAASDLIVNSKAGQFVTEHVGIAGDWIGTNAAAAGKMIGENAAIAKVWIGKNADIAGSWIGERSSSAVDWFGATASNACNWIIENGVIVGAWFGETTSGARMWIGKNASSAGTMIGETASGAGIWINEKVTDKIAWIKENSLFSKDGIAVMGNNLADFGIEKAEELEELAVGIKDYVKTIDPSVYTTKEYYIQTGEKLLLGEYSDANMTGLAVGLNILASVVNLDMAMDLRDLAHDIQYIGDGSVGIVELGIDAASCLPVIGIVKNVKYLDDVKDIAKAVDGITDVADGIKDASKVADIVDDVKDASKVADIVDDVKDASKVADIVDDVKDASKVVDAADGIRDASKVADIVDDTKDASKVADIVDDVKDASNAAEAADDVHDTMQAADMVDDVKESAKAAEVADDVKDASKATDTADDVKDASKAVDVADDAHDNYKAFRTINDNLENTVHPETGIKFSRKYLDYSDGRHITGVFPEFDAYDEIQLPDNLVKSSFSEQKNYLIKELQSRISDVENNSSLISKFTQEELDEIADGILPAGLTWHHNEEEGLMQLVDSVVHDKTGHTGGMSIWGKGY